MRQSCLSIVLVGSCCLAAEGGEKRERETLMKMMIACFLTVDANRNDADDIDDDNDSNGTDV